ncbi:MAG: sulfatase [Gemmataceae bacterium]
MLRLTLFLAVLSIVPTAAAQGPPARKLPNIVWITSEDHGPHLGCYGDKVAKTPTIDALSKKGMRFRRVWSNAPVCAPARTTIISGLYPTSTGSEHMRSLTKLPPDMHMFPYYLRLLGYYCSNRIKEDYNLEKGAGVWDDSSGKAHWKNRKPGQPFFAVFNSVKSHESQIRNYKKEPKTDPKSVRIPAYHPDMPAVRTDWARYYDTLALVDADAAAVLRELEDAGLLEETIIFYFSDHGSGMPRNKRTPLDSGLHVPMIAVFPEKWKHLAPKEYAPGGESNRLVGFIDLAPTMLSLAGQEPPAWMQGQAFAGQHAKDGPKYLHGFRGRMDERYDLQRSVTDGRYVYLRNYMPHLPAGQHVEYMFETRTTTAWKKAFDQGKLNDAQSRFWIKPRQAEELYDLEQDPDEVQNIADVESVRIQTKLKEMRDAHREHRMRIRDVGLLPEDEIHARSKGTTPYSMGRDATNYDLEAIANAADVATNVLARFDAKPLLIHGDSAVRYWAVTGVLIRGGKSLEEHRVDMLKAMHDSSPSVCVPASECFATFGTADEKRTSVARLVELGDPRKNSPYVVLAALNSLDRLGDLIEPHRKTIESWPAEIPRGFERPAAGIPRLLTRIRKEQ